VIKAINEIIGDYKDLYGTSQRVLFLERQCHFP